MSDEEVKRHRFSVSMDDFIRFLEEKTRDRECPACRCPHWTVLGASSTDLSYRLITTMLDGAGTVSVNTLGLFCNECGYVRQHMAKIVRTWVDENPAPEQLELDEMSADDVE